MLAAAAAAVSVFDRAVLNELDEDPAGVLRVNVVDHGPVALSVSFDCESCGRAPMEEPCEGDHDASITAVMGPPKRRHRAVDLRGRPSGCARDAVPSLPDRIGRHLGPWCTIDGLSLWSCEATGQSPRFSNAQLAVDPAQVIVGDVVHLAGRLATEHGPVGVIGHSFGGVLALAAAVAAPESIRGHVPVDPAPADDDWPPGSKEPFCASRSRCWTRSRPRTRRCGQHLASLVGRRARAVAGGQVFRGSTAHHLGVTHPAGTPR